MRMVPKRSNHPGTSLKKILDIPGEGIGFFTLDVDCPKDTILGLVEDGNDDFRAGGAECSQVAGIGGDVANIHDLLLRDGCTRQPLGKWEGGMFRLAGPAPGNVSYESSRMIDVVETYPAVVVGTSYERGNFLEGGLTTGRRDDDVLEMR